MRWTTGLGILLGGTGGAVAALMGASQPARLSETRAAPSSTRPSPVAKTSAEAAPTPPASVSAPASPGSAPDAAPSSAAIVMPTDVPGTREALMKAMLFCDQKQDFDACTRAAFAFDLGSAGPADPEQAKRFRKIALTHLVTQCEGGWAHACFVLAAKYRAGTEMPKNDASASVLEKRAVELCRHNTAPECPQ